MLYKNKYATVQINALITQVHFSSYIFIQKQYAGSSLLSAPPSEVRTVGDNPLRRTDQSRASF